MKTIKEILISKTLLNLCFLIFINFLVVEGQSTLPQQGKKKYIDKKEVQDTIKYKVVNKNKTKKRKPIISTVDDEFSVDGRFTYIREGKTIVWNMDSLIKELDEKSININEEGINNTTYTYLMPVFPGGEDSLIAFLGREIKWPNIPGCSEIEGTVYATFIVDKTGTIKDVKIKKGIGIAFDEEVIRVIYAMPKWIPGSKNSINVSCNFTLPIKFLLR